jgi:hypothetical protein
MKSLRFPKLNFKSSKTTWLSELLQRALRTNESYHSSQYHSALSDTQPYSSTARKLRKKEKTKRFNLQLPIFFIMKQLIVFSLLLLFFAKWIDQPTTYCVTVPLADLHEQADLKSPVLGQYMYGQHVQVVEWTDAWAKVSINDVHGYLLRAALGKCLQDIAPPNDPEVIICNSPNAYAYHSRECSGLARCVHSTSRMSKSAAIDKGRTACKICW